MKPKDKMIKEAIIEFRDSCQRVSDYMNLFIAVEYVTRQGSGLMWSQINEILRNEVPTI